MKQKKKWTLLYTEKGKESGLDADKILQIVLKNRGLETKKEIEEFLHPSLEKVTIASVGIEINQVKKTLTRLKTAYKQKEKIVVFGDYDVDGITGTAILWETLHKNGWDVVPYIPHRIDEGYGLSVKGIENVVSQIENVKVIITVDNGIVAYEAVAFANKKDIDVIITDHHTPPVGENEKNPDAFAIVHTTKLCGAAVAWMLSQEIKRSVVPNVVGSDNKNDHLDLVALATVADLVPLTGANRTLLTAGLPFLRQTKRVGLLALFQEAGLDPENIGVYEVGHIIGPRLNAMGRMESAMDSLRLLCTKNPARALVLAQTLGTTNRERQLVTQSASQHAIEQFKLKNGKTKNVLFIANETYEEGVIGLVAGKLVEEFYKPSIVISKREKVSKASARSVAGFNIIEFIRSASHLLVNAGGHPMAAGFTVETEKIALLQEYMETLAEKKLADDLLTPILKIDCEIPLAQVSQELYEKIQSLSPFGMANAEPVFMSQGVVVDDIKAIGQDKKHLKLRISSSHPEFARHERGRMVPGSHSFEAIAFGMGEKIQEIKIGNTLNIAYTIDENKWNGNKKLQLKVKDIA